MSDPFHTHSANKMMDDFISFPGEHEQSSTSISENQLEHLLSLESTQSRCAKEKREPAESAQLEKVEASCILCVASKVKCEYKRPCSRCEKKGLSNLCFDRRIPKGLPKAEKNEPCITCLAAKVKCDFKSPCSRCETKGFKKLCVTLSQLRNPADTNQEKDREEPMKSVLAFTCESGDHRKKRISPFPESSEFSSKRLQTGGIPAAVVCPTNTMLNPAASLFDKILSKETVEKILNRHRTCSPFTIQKLVTQTPCRWFGYLRAIAKLTDTTHLMRIKNEMYEIAASLSTWYEMSFVRMIVLSNVCRISPKKLVADRITKNIVLCAEQQQILSRIFGSEEKLLTKAAMTQFRPNPLALSGKESVVKCNFDVNDLWYSYIGYSTKDIVDFLLELGNYQRTWADDGVSAKDPTWFLQLFDPESWGRYFEGFHNLWVSDFEEPYSSSWRVFENMGLVSKSGTSIRGTFVFIITFNKTLCGIPRQLTMAFIPNSQDSLEDTNKESLGRTKN